MDFSQALAKKRDTIVQNWIEVVRQDCQIPASDHLPRSVIRNHLCDGAKTLELVLDCDRAPTRVLTDSLRLQQIVNNVTLPLEIQL